MSEAFLRGITFKRLAELDTTQPLRVVEISLPPGTDQLLRTLPGMEDFDGTTECLSLLKPGFGLKDAQGCGTWHCSRFWLEGGLHCVNTDRQLFVNMSMDA